MSLVMLSEWSLFVYYEMGFCSCWCFSYVLLYAVLTTWFFMPCKLCGSVCHFNYMVVYAILTGGYVCHINHMVMYAILIVWFCMLY